jgi:hypothetical protein
LTTLDREWGNLTAVLGARTAARQITSDDVGGYAVKRRELAIERGLSIGWKAHEVSNETIMRELQTLKRGMSIATRKNKITRPIRDWPELTRTSSERGKGRLIALEDLKRWFVELQFEPRDEDGNRKLKDDQDAFEEARVVLLTGIRSAEVSRLEWSWVQPAVQKRFALYMFVPQLPLHFWA